MRVSQALVEELLYEEEGATLDSKSQAYPFNGADDLQKSELLKDILAFANTFQRTDAYILIGVEEVQGGRSRPVGVTDHLQDAHLQQFVSSKTQHPVELSYTSMEIDGVKIGVIRVPQQQVSPQFLEEGCENVSSENFNCVVQHLVDVCKHLVRTNRRASLDSNQSELAK